MQKLQFAPVNSVLATQFSISYTAAVALTGIPFIVSGFAGVVWGLISLCIGKRMVYITAALLMLIGQLWNMHVHDWGQFMGGRILQGVGWGAFAMVEGNLREMFFVSSMLPTPT
jgi:nitrate/nitrite transporter NarK